MSTICIHSKIDSSLIKLSCHGIVGKYYLVDCGYGAKPSFLPPFRGVRYHLKEWGNANLPQDEKELFNLRHSQLRVTVERAFG